MQIRNIINFSGHPLSKEVVETLEQDGCTVETVSVGLYLKESVADQIKKLVDNVRSIPLDGSVPFAITLPGLSESTAFLLSELHGRCGFFPKILQIRKGKLGPFEISNLVFPESLEPGVVDLERVRLKARGRRNLGFSDTKRRKNDKKSNK